MKAQLITGLVGLLLSWSATAWGFCGLYVSKADTKLFNKASKVVMARDGNRTVLTMSNDYQGDPTEFAMVIPVPTFIERNQIHIGNQATIDHLDAYSAPRLVEYYDEDPCSYRRMDELSAQSAVTVRAAKAPREKALGVTVEAQYTVGEYDIIILSAEQSNGLETWLTENGYKIPAGASEVLGSYLKQNMRFFVARVNLTEAGKLGYNFLRPLQIAFESPKFMLPIRLGTVNANGTQELFIFTLTHQGRVETTNYRTVRLPSNMDIPEFVKDTFADFYRDMFTHQTQGENMKAVFLEYAWDMGWCDPCAAEPLSNDELLELGVMWLNREQPIIMRGGGTNVFVTRLHVRYDGEHFPEDLVFQETGDRGNFQGRYVMRHPWTGDHDCAAVDEYRKSLRERQEREAQTLADLTGWDHESIRTRMGLDKSPSTGIIKWWEKLWGTKG